MGLLWDPFYFIYFASKTTYFIEKNTPCIQLREMIFMHSTVFASFHNYFAMCSQIGHVSDNGRGDRKRMCEPVEILDGGIQTVPISAVGAVLLDIAPLIAPPLARKLARLGKYHTYTLST